MDGLYSYDKETTVAFLVAVLVVVQSTKQNRTLHGKRLMPDGNFEALYACSDQEDSREVCSTSAGLGWLKERC
jgi:hypothetical protein